MIVVEKEMFSSSVTVKIKIDGTNINIGTLTPLFWGSKGADDIRLYVDNRLQSKIVFSASRGKAALYFKAQRTLMEEYDKMMENLVGESRKTLTDWTRGVEYRNEIK